MEEEHFKIEIVLKKGPLMTKFERLREGKGMSREATLKEVIKAGIDKLHLDWMKNDVK
jgi:hypothetical protein